MAPFLLRASMVYWPTRVGAVLHLLDPATGPRLVLNNLWQEVLAWQGSIAGIWLQSLPGHLAPAGTFMVGERPESADDIAALASPITAPMQTDGLPVVARQLRDGNVPIATLLVSHRNSQDAAAFLIDVLSRYCLDRLRVQLEVSELTEENQALRGALTYHVRQTELLTHSGIMHSLVQTAVRAANSTATVLLQGETGTGKELLAKLIHSHSRRSSKPMVSVNAGALSSSLLESELFGHVRGAYTGADHDRKGLFEIAHGGTLFLDEVGELGLDVQVRLLRVLQERVITRVGDHIPIPVDVRIIAATHRDLNAEIRTGRFREDLYYRLNVVSMVVPPLRNRREDIPLLINHFLSKYNRENFKNVDDIPRPVLDMLCRYPWPGNIRELENCIQKAVVLAPGTVFLQELLPPTICSYADHLPRLEDSMPSTISDPLATVRAALEQYADAESPSIARFVQQAERILIIWTLNRERGVKLRAAKALGINRVTLDRKLAEFGINVKRGVGVVDSGGDSSDDSDSDSDDDKAMLANEATA